MSKFNEKEGDFTNAKQIFYKLGEAARYLGLSKSTLYKLTSKKEISHYKPNGKTILFEEKQLWAWATRNCISSTHELSDKALEYLTNPKGGGK